MHGLWVRHLQKLELPFSIIRDAKVAHDSAKESILWMQARSSVSFGGKGFEGERSFPRKQGTAVKEREAARVPLLAALFPEAK